MIFESLEDAQENTGRFIGIMALSGQGKSSLGTSLKNRTLWISTDHGLTGLYKHEGYDPANFTVVKINSLEQYEEFYRKFVSGELKDQHDKPILPSDFTNVIYDDMTQLTIWGEARADLNEETQRAIENEGVPENKQKKRDTRSVYGEVKKINLGLLTSIKMDLCIKEKLNVILLFKMSEADYKDEEGVVVKGRNVPMTPGQATTAHLLSALDAMGCIKELVKKDTGEVKKYIDFKLSDGYYLKRRGSLRDKEPLNLELIIEKIGQQNKE